MQVLMIDNYDSFTYNIVQYFGELGARCARCFATMKSTLEEIGALRPPDRLVISPGPCSPAEAGIFCGGDRGTLRARLPILGVCLGPPKRLALRLAAPWCGPSTLMHGKTSMMHNHDARAVSMRGCRSSFTVNRYHSLAIAKDALSLPAELDSQRAWTDDGEIMGVRHHELACTPTPLQGVQFHPESDSYRARPRDAEELLGAARVIRCAAEPLPAEHRAAPKPAGIPSGDRSMYASTEGRS